MKVKIFLTGFVLLVVTAFASAQPSGPAKGNGLKNCNGTGKCAAYVDTNQNGICDTYENRTNTASRRNSHRTGNSTGNDQRMGKGKNFVDSNNNGVCDSYESGTKKLSPATIPNIKKSPIN